MTVAERQAIEEELHCKGDHRPKLVSIPEFGRSVGVGRTMAYELVARSEVEVVSIGARRLVVAESIDSYVSRLRKTAGA